jgi:hypothetical protein
LTEKNNISQFISSQFPAIYREEGETFIAFVEAYYEWAESANKSAYNEGRRIIEHGDIDTTPDAFVEHFRETYLKGFPFHTSVDQRFLVKHILDFYRTKGSKQGIELLMKILFGEEVEIYYPGEDILRVSDSKWVKPNYIEVSPSERTRGFVDKKITGSQSGATAYVDSVVRKRMNGTLIDIIYISSVKGKFNTGELITDDGDVEDAPLAIGSLTRFEVSSGGRNNKIGDVFNVVAEDGAHGKIRVTGVENATGRVDFKLWDGGNGYTTDEFTKVYVSNTILTVENSNFNYLDFDIVYQPIESVELLSANTFLSGVTIGDTVKGVDSANTEIASGTIVAFEKQGSEGAVKIDVTSGSFQDQVKLIANSTPMGFLVGHDVTESTTALITVTGIVGTAVVGEELKQIVYVANTNNSIVSSVATGIIDSVTGDNIHLTNVFGDFKGGAASSSSANLTITGFVELVTPAKAKVSNITGNTISLSSVVGQFDSNSKIQSTQSRAIVTIQSVQSQGTSDLVLSKNDARAVVDITANNWIVGTVVGQNTTSIGVYGNTNFYVSNTFPLYIRTDRSGMLSPPKDANGNVIEVVTPILAKSTGTNAGFRIGNLSKQQNVTVATDMIADKNVSGTPYVDIFLNGMGSGTAYILQFNVNTAGSGYTNNDVVMLQGGGIGNSAPVIAGMGLISTNANGAITSVSVDEPGAGYYEMPTVVLPNTSGTAANVSVLLKRSYGFVKDPAGDENTPLEFLLDSKFMTIGSIESIKSINPGVNYNADPFVKIYNKSVASFQRGDYILQIANNTGVFQQGEVIQQVVNGEAFLKGTVRSHNTMANVLLIRRELFETGFSNNTPIMGSVTGAMADIVTISKTDEYIFGDNAMISANVIAANGVITSTEVIDSGYGYKIGEGELVASNNEFIVSGTIHVENHGFGEGFWKSTSSHLNSEKKIQDNKYYQEFSYDIISSLSLDKYSKILKQITHVAGTEMFGSVNRQSNFNVKADVDFTIEID